VSYFPFSSESELLTRLELALDEIARDYSSKQTPLRVQAALSDFAQGTHNLQKMFWTPEREARFVSECLIHDALWPIVTVSGIEGTFLSGERAELLGLLKFHNYAPTPGHLYNLVRHAVNYEEKAFAKNIRAFKDVGILFKAPKGISGRAAARLVKLSRFGFILPARNIQKTLAEYERELTFVKEQLILTEFGRDLCDYVAGRRQKRELLEKLLEAKRKTADLLFDAAMLREQIPGRMEYLLELVPPEQRSRLLSIL